MAYSTLDDLKEQLDETTLIELTDDAGSGTVDTTVTTRAIADADEEIDGYVGGRTTVPLYPVPGIIRKLSVDIALYNLFSRRHDSIPEIRKERYDNAVKFLVKVAEGKISLGQNDPDPPASGGDVDYTQAVDAVMTSTKLDNF